MGQLDSRIALSATVPQMRDPFQTLGQMSQLRSYQEDQKQRQIMNQQENERRDLMLRDRRNAEEDQSVFQGLVQQHGNIDDALDEMDNQGRSEFAVGLRGKVNAERLKGLDVETKRGANQLQAFKTVGQIWSGVSDNSTHQTALPASRAIFKANGLDPTLLDHLGQHYDEKATPKLIEDAMKWGGMQQDVLNAQKGAMDVAQKVVTDAKSTQERDEYGTKALAIWLPTVTSQEKWTQGLDYMEALGAPKQTRAKFGEEFSPASIARAKALGLTPKESADAPADAKRLAFEGQRVAFEGQRVGLEGRRVTLAEQDAKDATSGAPGTGRGRSLTANAESGIAGRQQKAYKELEDEMRTSGVLEVKDTDGNWYPSTTSTYPKDVTLTSETRIPDAAKAQYVQRKLAIENGFRAERLMPSLEQAEYDLDVAGNAKELRIIRNKYKKLTEGQDAPLERIQKLDAAVRREKDPDKKAGMKKQLKDLVDEYQASRSLAPR